MAEIFDNVMQVVLDKTDIIELINDVTPLEKKGKNHVGLCPFHDEKTPSFSVSEDKQLYHCFGCKASGNAITFVKETEHVETRDAIKLLAERAGVDLTTFQFKEDPLDKYYNINQEALTFYQVYLNHTEQGQSALEYLKKRAITKEIIDTFDIGLAPDKKDALFQALKKQNTLLSDMADLNLVSDRDDVYDIFRGRIMFALHNKEGKVVGFSGRVFKDSDKTLAKYMNTSATPVFEKSEVLYNMHRAKKAIKDANRVIIFEGFMDVIASFRAGISEAVAVMGTALTSQHIRQLAALTKNVTLCFDGDQAGQDATLRFVKTLEDARMHVKIAIMPDKLDPDDYIARHGEKAFRHLINDALSAKEYAYSRALSQVNLEKITEVELLKKRVFGLIKNASSVEQDYYVNKLADDTKISKELLIKDFNAIRRDKIPVYKPIQKIEVTDKYIRAERGFIHYFLKDEYFARRFRHEFDDVTYIDKAARDIQLEIFEYYDLNRTTCIVPECFEEKLAQAQKHYFNTYIKVKNYPFQDQEFEDYLSAMHEYNRRLDIESLRKAMEETDDMLKKIEIKMRIDAINKEGKHGKRKNNSRSYRLQ